MEIFTYHWLSPKVLSLDKTKKNKIFFCIVLAYWIKNSRSEKKYAFFSLT